MLRKKITITDIFLFLFLSLTFLLILFTLNFVIEQNNMNKITNNYYSKESIHFFINAENSPPDLKLSKILNKANTNDYVIYKENLDENDKDIRGMITFGNVERPPLIKGRFFRESDYYKNKKISIVGRNVDYTVNKNGEKCYFYNGDCYKVVGIMGTEYKTRLDKMVYLNLDAFDPQVGGSYVLDGENDNIKKVYNEFKHKNKIEVNQIDAEERGTSRILDQDRNSLRVAIVLIGIVLIKNFLIALYWLYKKRINIAIQVLIGIQKKRIIISLLKKYIFIMSLSLVFCSSVFILFDYRIYINNYHIIHTILFELYITLFAMFSMVSSIYIYSYNNKKTLKVMK